MEEREKTAQKGRDDQRFSATAGISILCIRVHGNSSSSRQLYCYESREMTGLR